MGAHISDGCVGSMGGYNYLFRLSKKSSTDVFASLPQMLCNSSSLLTATAVTSDWSGALKGGLQ